MERINIKLIQDQLITLPIGSRILNCGIHYVPIPVKQLPEGWKGSKAEIETIYLEVDKSKSKDSREFNIKLKGNTKDYKPELSKDDVYIDSFEIGHANHKKGILLNHDILKCDIYYSINQSKPQ